MQIFHRFLSRRSLLCFVGVVALLFGLAMLHPYPRQSLFGPTIRGRPWCVWEEAVRRQCGERSDSMADKCWRWLGRDRQRQMTFEDLFDDQEMLPLVVALVDDADPEIRSACVIAISALPSLQDRSSLPALRKCFQEGDLGLRMVAGCALWRIDRDPAVLRWFVELLDAADPLHRTLAMHHLAEFSAHAPELYPHIIAHAKDTTPGMRVRVMTAMAHFGNKGVPILIVGMNDADIYMRYRAALVAEKIGPDARDAIPALETFLQDSDPGLVHAARSALRAIDPEGYKHLKDANE